MLGGIIIIIIITIKLGVQSLTHVYHLHKSHILQLSFQILFELIIPIILNITGCNQNMEATKSQSVEELDSWPTLIVVEFSTKADQVTVEWIQAKIQSAVSRGGADLLVKPVEVEDQKVQVDIRYQYQTTNMA